MKIEELEKNLASGNYELYPHAIDELLKLAKLAFEIRDQYRESTIGTMARRKEFGKRANEILEGIEKL